MSAVSPIGIYAVIGVLIIAAVSALSKRLGVAAPIVLLLVGLSASYLPTAPSLQVPQDWVLNGLLPPILYAAAITIPLTDFRRNIGTIASLSVALVVFTAFGAGIVLYGLLPGLGIATAIAFGAIISPTDPVAASSIGRRLGLPTRLLTVLEGEGLVNDATALVLLRSALIVAAAGGAFSPLQSAGAFVYGVIVAVGVGFLVGFLNVRVRSILSDPVLDTAVSIAVPFVAFIPATMLGASGVLAVVVAGLYTGHAAPRKLSAQARINWRINWKTIQFLLENGVFLVIGLELRPLVEGVLDQAGLPGVGVAVLTGLATVAVLIVLRVVWVVPLIYALKLSDRHRKNVPNTPRSDAPGSTDEPLGWRAGVLLSWAGMRGVVTLAAAQSLPNDTPYRSQLVLIAYTVAVVTTLLQGSTLGPLARFLGGARVDTDKSQRELAELLQATQDAGLAVLEDPATYVDYAEEIDSEMLEEVARSSRVRSDLEWERLRRSGTDPAVKLSRYELYRKLRLAVVAAEREYLLEARARREYPSSALAQVQGLLDLEESHLRARP